MSERIKTLISSLRKRGHERLTVMLIPHGQEKVFSLQLNWYMIVFLTGTLMLAVSLSVYGILIKTEREREIEALKNLYGFNYNSAVQLEQSAGQIQVQKTRLIENMEKLAVEIGFPAEELAVLPDVSAAQIRASGILSNEVRQRKDMGPTQDYLSPIYNLRSLFYLFEDREILLNAMDSFTDDGLGVYRTMPLGRPHSLSAGLRDTSGFGRRINPKSRTSFEFHQGFDVAGPEGTPIYATADGIVQRAVRMDGGYGNFIVLQHENGFFSLYAHLSRILVQPGMEISRGQWIGTMGRTGRVTGTHLHYEVWQGNTGRIDPLPYICALDLQSATCRRFQ